MEGLVSRYIVDKCPSLRKNLVGLSNGRTHIWTCVTSMEGCVEFGSLTRGGVVRRECLGGVRIGESPMHRRTVERGLR